MAQIEVNKVSKTSKKEELEYSVLWCLWRRIGSESGELGTLAMG